MMKKCPLKKVGHYIKHYTDLTLFPHLGHLGEKIPTVHEVQKTRAQDLLVHFQTTDRDKIPPNFLSHAPHIYFDIFTLFYLVVA